MRLVARISAVLALSVLLSAFASQIESAKLAKGLKWKQGFIVVKLKDAPGNLGMVPGSAAQSKFGVATLDELCEEYSVRSVKPLFRVSEPVVYRGEEIDLTRYIAVTFDRTIDLETIMDAFERETIVDRVEASSIEPLNAVPDDPEYPYQWHLPKIQAPEAWDLQTGDPSVVVAVIDGGVFTHVQDLGGINAATNPRGNFWVNDPELYANGGVSGVDDDGNGFVDDSIGWNFTLNIPDPNPTGGSAHGTRISAIIAAMNNNAYEAASIAGGFHSGSTPDVGNGVRIMALNTGTPSGGSESDAEAIARAYVYAANNGANIANQSGNADYPADYFQDAVKYFMAKGGLICKAAGNDASVFADFMDARSDVICVASTTPDDRRYSTSDLGGKIEVSAPGESIAASHFESAQTGTSYAAPVAAGVAALIWSHNPGWTAEQVRERLLQSADNIDASLRPNDLGNMGAGRVNAFKALSLNDCDDHVWALHSGGSGEQRGAGIDEAADGSLLLAGHRVDEVTADNDATLTLYDPCGTYVETVTYSSAGVDEVGVDILSLGANSNALVGTRDPDGPGSRITYRLVDNAGSETYGADFAGDGRAAATASVISSDGGHTVVGYTYDASGNANSFVIKFSGVSPGAVSWQASLGGVPTDERAYSIDSLTGGEHVIAGASEHFSGSDRAFVTRLNAAGNAAWTTQFSAGTEDYQALEVRRQRTGEILVLCSTTPAATSHLAAIITTSSSGDSVSAQLLPVSDDKSVRTFAVTADGGTVVAYDNRDPQWEHNRIELIKYDPDGTTVGADTIGTDYATEIVNSMRLAGNQAYLMAGTYDIDHSVVVNDPQGQPQQHVVMNTDVLMARTQSDSELGRITLVVPDQYSTIQAALNAAEDGWLVLVRAGIYSGFGNRNLDFNGKAVELASEDGPAATVIDCQDFGRAFKFSDGETNATIVRGFTIYRGNSMMFFNGREGGGIRIESSPTISDCLIYSCRASKGGGIYVKTGAVPVIEGCTIVDNTGTGAGVAFQSSDIDIHFEQCVVANNNGIGMYDESGSGQLLPECNVYWSNAGGDYVGFAHSGSLNKTADPWFWDRSNGDYHLRPYSPCYFRNSLCDERIGAFGLTDQVIARRGDVDWNGTAWETTDVDAFRAWFSDGDVAFTVDLDSQTLATDINGDGYVLTVADYYQLCDVVFYSGPSSTGLGAQYTIRDTLQMRDTTVYWPTYYQLGKQGIDLYLGNYGTTGFTGNVDGIQARIVFDPDFLTPVWDPVLNDGVSVEYNRTSRTDENTDFRNGEVIVQSRTAGEVMVYMLPPQLHGGIQVIYPTNHPLGSTDPVLTIFFEVEEDGIHDPSIGFQNSGYFVNQVAHLSRAFVPVPIEGRVTEAPSCPVLYSYDGTRFNLENTLLTGCEYSGYKELVTDYYHLSQSLPGTDDALRFQLREEEDEVSYIHDLRLMTVDHSASTRLATTVDGTVFSYERTVAPVRAVDHHGTNRLRDVQAEDGRLFESAESGYLLVTFAATERGVKLASAAKESHFPGPPGRVSEGLQRDLPPVSTLSVKSTLADGQVVTYPPVPPRERPSTDFLVSDYASSVQGEVTYRIEWQGRYSTDAVLQFTPTNEHLAVSEVSPSVASALRRGSGLPEPLNFQSQAEPVTLKRGDILDMEFEVAPLENTGLVRDYVLIARGRYEPDLAVFSAPVPDRYELFDNYPNPFNPATTIAFDLPSESHVNLTVINILGQQVETLVDEVMPAGRHTVYWQGSAVASGIYFYQLQTEEYEATRKMLLVK